MKELMDIKVKEVSRVRLRPREVLIVKIDIDYLPEKMRKDLEEYFADIFRKNKVIIVDRRFNFGTFWPTPE